MQTQRIVIWYIFNYYNQAIVKLRNGFPGSLLHEKKWSFSVKAHRENLNIHVWVDETRPRNQGASLTAYELQSEGIPYSVIVDNAGGYLMQNNF